MSAPEKHLARFHNTMVSVVTTILLTACAATSVPDILIKGSGTFNSLPFTASGKFRVAVDEGRLDDAVGLYLNASRDREQDSPDFVRKLERMLNSRWVPRLQSASERLTTAASRSITEWIAARSAAEQVLREYSRVPVLKPENRSELAKDLTKAIATLSAQVAHSEMRPSERLLLANSSPHESGGLMMRLIGSNRSTLYVDGNWVVQESADVDVLIRQAKSLGRSLLWLFEVKPAVESAPSRQARTTMQVDTYLVLLNSEIYYSAEAIARDHTLRTSDMAAQLDASPAQRMSSLGGAIAKQRASYAALERQAQQRNAAATRAVAVAQANAPKVERSNSIPRTSPHSQTGDRPSPSSSAIIGTGGIAFLEGRGGEGGYTGGWKTVSFIEEWRRNVQRAGHNVTEVLKCDDSDAIGWYGRLYAGWEGGDSPQGFEAMVCGVATFKDTFEILAALCNGNTMCSRQNQYQLNIFFDMRTPMSTRHDDTGRDFCKSNSISGLRQGCWISQGGIVDADKVRSTLNAKVPRNYKYTTRTWTGNGQAPWLGQVAKQNGKQPLGEGSLQQ